MSIADALNHAAQHQGLSNVQIAAAIGVSESAVHKWRASKTEPRGAQLMALRRAYPMFADLLDGKAAA